MSDSNKSIFDEIGEKFRNFQGMKKINYLDSFINEVNTNYNGNIEKGILSIKDREKFVQLIREIKEKYLAKHISKYDILFRLCDIIFIFTALGIQMVEYYYDRHFDDRTNNLIKNQQSTREKMLSKLSILNKEKKRFILH